MVYLVSVLGCDHSVVQGSGGSCAGDEGCSFEDVTDGWR